MSQPPPLGNPLGPGQGSTPPLPPPVPLGYAPPPVQEGPDIRKVAAMQRTIMYCILSEILIVIGRVTFATNGNVTGLLLLGLVYIVVGIIAAVCIFILALSLYNTALGIVLGILTLIPVVGLIVLLVVNSKATTVLRQNGLKVGLMGAKLPPLPKA